MQSKAFLAFQLLKSSIFNNSVHKATFSCVKETLFERIANKSIPAHIIFEDDCVAFRDANPCAPVHFLVVPKKCDNLTQLRFMKENQEQLIGHLMNVASKVALKEGLSSGYRIVLNDGADALQSVFHIHLHVMGGKKCCWPPV